MTGRSDGAECGIAATLAQRLDGSETGTRRQPCRFPRTGAGVRVGVEPAATHQADVLDAVEVRGRVHQFQFGPAGVTWLDRHHRIGQAGCRDAVEHRTEALRAFGMTRAGKVVEIGSVCCEQHRHAADATVGAVMIGGPLTLRGEGVSTRVLEWPSQPGVAQLIMYQQHRLPTADELTRWADMLRGRGFHRIRTSALAPAASHRVESVGFHTVQELVLLEHDHPRGSPKAALPSHRLLVGQHAAASALDHAAFGPGWSLDPVAIAEVRNATPHHRARAAGGTEPTAYAITGRDGRQGFLQRLAVHPDQQSHGLGRALVNDCLRWLALWRVDRVLVNTPVHNHVAIRLYETAGFRRLGERLRVYERELS